MWAGYPLPPPVSPLTICQNVSLTVQEPSIEGFGMYGSGLFIVNPPWTLPNTLNEVMPYLTEKLSVDNGASFEIDCHIS